MDVTELQKLLTSRLVELHGIDRDYDNENEESIGGW